MSFGIGRTNFLRSVCSFSLRTMVGLRSLATVDVLLPTVGALVIVGSVVACRSATSAASAKSAKPANNVRPIGAGPSAPFDAVASEDRKAALADLEGVWVTRTRIANIYNGKKTTMLVREANATGPSTPLNTRVYIVTCGDRSGSHGADADRDGISDEAEKKIGLDPNNPDTDGDGIPDGFELFGTGTRPGVADSDGDGVSDGMQFQLDDPNMYLDDDQDGLLNGQELVAFGTDPENADSDEDSFGDAAEFMLGTEPQVANEDNDGDSFPDDFEAANMNDPNPADATSEDSDDDGLPDWLDPSSAPTAQVRSRQHKGRSVAANSPDCNTNAGNVNR